MTKNEIALKRTKNWLEDFVLGLNLCPFARHPFRNEKVHYVVYEGDNLENLTQIVVKELDFLNRVTPAVVETTLIILLDALKDFDEYLDFLEVVEFVVEKLDMDVAFQIASFHPSYQFDGTDETDSENYTNRSPFPMLHLLREDSVTRAVEAFPEVGDIPARNIQTMNDLGLLKIKEMLNAIKR